MGLRQHTDEARRGGMPSVAAGGPQQTSREKPYTPLPGNRVSSSGENGTARACAAQLAVLGVVLHRNTPLGGGRRASLT